MQTYIDRGGELVYQPPFVSDEVEYYGFILDADKSKLQELCDFSSRLHEARILGSNYDVIIEQCDSHPICADFGMPATGALRSKLNFYVNFDFQIGLGAIIPPKA